MGETIVCDQMQPNDAIVVRAVSVLRGGGVIVLPTDSVYGICCAAVAGNPAHEKIFRIKQRDPSQTLPLFIADASDLDRIATDVPDWARRAAALFWPGALTLVVRASKTLPAEYTQTYGSAAPTVAVRVPGSPLVCAIVRTLGLPLAQTSANTHGAPSATSGSSLEPAVSNACDLVLDAGPAPLSVASTIVDATADQLRVLREGAITREELFAACG